MRKGAVLLIVVALALLVAVGGYLAWSQRDAPPHASPPLSSVRATPPVAPATGEPQVKYPLPDLSGLQHDALPEPGKMDAFIAARLAELLGSVTVQSMLQMDGFLRRVVVTIDNLGREHAAQMLWPVNPTQGRFLVADVKGQAFISSGNSRRYTPFVTLVESADLERAMTLYIRLYPSLQRVYEELGYPGRYFNDRVVEVVDSMLAAPDPVEAVRVRMTEVRGPIKVSRPWLHYEFADSDLQKAPAGQKLLVRIGPDNEKRIKARLRELRGLLTRNRP